MMGPHKTSMDDFLLNYAMQKAKELDFVKEGDLAVVSQRIQGNEILKIVAVEDVMLDTYGVDKRFEPGFVRNQSSASLTQAAGEAAM